MLINKKLFTIYLSISIMAITTGALVGRGYGGGGHGGTHGGGFGHAGNFEPWGSSSTHGFGRGHGGISGGGTGFDGGDFGGDSGGLGQRSHAFGFGGTGFDGHGRRHTTGAYVTHSSTPFGTIYGPIIPVRIPEQHGASSTLPTRHDTHTSHHHTPDPNARTGIDKNSGYAWGAWSTYGDWYGPWGGWWGPVWWQWNLGWPSYQEHETAYNYPRDEGKSILLNANSTDITITYNALTIAIMPYHTVQIPKKTTVTVTNGTQEAHFNAGASYYAVQGNSDGSFTVVAYDDAEPHEEQDS